MHSPALRTAAALALLVALMGVGNSFRSDDPAGHRAPAPAAAATPPSAPTYVVQPGDYPRRIAARLCDDELRWKEFTYLNGDPVGETIYPQEVVLVPPGCTGDGVQTAPPVTAPQADPNAQHGNAAAEPSGGDSRERSPASGLSSGSAATIEDADLSGSIAGSPPVRLIAAVISIAHANPWEASVVVLIVVALYHLRSRLADAAEDISWHVRRAARAPDTSSDTHGVMDGAASSPSWTPVSYAAPAELPQREADTSGPAAHASRETRWPQAASSLPHAPTPEGPLPTAPGRADAVTVPRADAAGRGQVSADRAPDEADPEPAGDQAEPEMSEEGIEDVPVSRSQEGPRSLARRTESARSDYQRDPFLGDPVFGDDDGHHHAPSPG